MPTTNEKIRDALLRYAHYVETLTDRQLRQLEKVLMESVNDINDQITRMGLAGTNLNVWERTRLLTLREEIEKVLAATTSRMSDQIEDNFRQIAFTATDEVNNILRASIPKDLIVMFNAVPLAQVIEFIDAPTGGLLWRDRMIQRYRDLLTPMDNIISRGVMQGWSVPQMVKEFKTLVGKEWKSGAWEQIIRTEVVRIGNAVNLATYKQNNDIIKGVQWLATLDFRVCPICAALDGRFWELGTFDLYIPAHPRCFTDPMMPILTYNGCVPINEIVVGDLVLTHKGRYQRVTNLIHTKNQKPEIVTLLLMFPPQIKHKVYDSFVVTANHPILVNGRWKLAKNITIEDHINYYDRANDVFIKLPVVDKYLETQLKPITLYNFSVEDDESYVAKGVIVHNCRCVLTPITKSWRELGFDVDELAPGTRASMNGQVPSTMKYSEWFGTQSAFFQRNWLGNKRYELWKNGKLEFEDFLDSKKLLKQPK